MTLTKFLIPREARALFFEEIGQLALAIALLIGTPADLASEPEVRKDHIVTCSLNVETNFLEKLITKYSSWYKMKRVCAWVIRFKNIWLGRSLTRYEDPFTINQIQKAENVI